MIEESLKRFRTNSRVHHDVNITSAFMIMWHLIRNVSSTCSMTADVPDRCFTKLKYKHYYIIKRNKLGHTHITCCDVINSKNK